MLESIDVFISSHESEISSGKFDFSHTRQMEAFEILVEIELMNSEN